MKRKDEVPRKYPANRCQFCGGNISEGRCIMCARSVDYQHEVYVRDAQKKPHFNWHSYHGEAGRIPKEEKEED